MITLIPLVVLALVGVVVAVRPLRRFLIVRWLSDAVGNQALKRLPDQIHLSPSRPEALHDAAAALALAKPLLECGFDDVGTYSIVEMPGVFMRLLVKPDESFTAAIYEHPRPARGSTSPRVIPTGPPARSRPCGRAASTRGREARACACPARATAENWSIRRPL